MYFFTLLIKSFPLLLPSHNCINNSQCSVFKVHLWVSLKKLNETSALAAVSVNFLSSLLSEVVGQNGLEPSTSRLSVVCSSQLSYWPVFSWLTSSSGTWWRLAGSNRWPPACKAGALPAELNPHIVGVNRAHSVSASSLRLPAKTSYRSVTPPPQMKPASLGFHLVSTIHFPVPSKLNNVLPSTLVWP